MQKLRQPSQLLFLINFFGSKFLLLIIDKMPVALQLAISIQSKLIVVKKTEKIFILVS